MMRKLIYIALSAVCLMSCARTETGCLPPLVSDCCGVTVPVNIAPLSFELADSLDARHVRVEYSHEGKTLKKSARIGVGAWHRMLERAAGSELTVKISAKVNGECLVYDPFTINVSQDEIDPYIAYRLVEPGYEIWHEMGIYQRCLENFRQSPVIENRMTDYGCVNCHSFSSYDPSKMIFHSRVACGGTYYINGGSVEKLNTKTPQTLSALVYPQWHPSGRYIAFSVNSTKQLFHTTDPNRIEVFDYTSDVVVYDVEKHEIFSSPLLKRAGKFETFPTFSPDGNTLYFCSADSLAMPENYDKVRYSLCSVGFNPEDRTFSEKVDTLYNARKRGVGSVSFPRVSPDGSALMFTLSGYGNFSIWHKDADLYVADLATKKISEASELNSADVESYHSWSSNGRWVIFSSRRMDKLYTRLFIAHVGEDGTMGKPFLLPQKKDGYYRSFMKSYNIPEFISGKVKNNQYGISRVAKKDAGVDLTFAE